MAELKWLTITEIFETIHLTLGIEMRVNILKFQVVNPQWRKFGGSEMAEILLLL